MAATRHSAQHRRFGAVIRAALAGSLTLTLTACATGGAQPQIEEVSGTVELNQTPINDVLVGGSGTGTVDFHGTIYHFAIGGLGVQGSAVAVIQTSGEVYRLSDIASFPGTYRRTSDTASVSGRPSGGLWLQNEHATMIHLAVPPGGQIPDIGSDAVRVVVDQ